MSIIWLCAPCAIAGWLFVRTQRWKKKYREVKTNYNTRCIELSNALREVFRLTIRLEDANKMLVNEKKRNTEFHHLFSSEFKLRAQEMIEFRDNLQVGSKISVVAYNTLHPDLYVEIRKFYFNPDDLDDYQFALREAEELIETINNF